jgi:cytochrome b
MSKTARRSPGAASGNIDFRKDKALMKSDDISSRNDLDALIRILHLGLVVFGLLALMTGDYAGDYKRAASPGFIVHGWIGIGVTVFVALRLAYGILGPAHARFSNWLPYTREQFGLVLEDITGLLKFRLPDRKPHQGLAALVEMSGLLLFSLLAITGVLLFLTIDPGHRAVGAVRFIKEIHEAGEVLLPLFFLGHGGAVLLHAIAGKHLWRKMIFLKES